MEDGFVVTYCRDDTISPIALTKAQYDMAQIVLASVCDHKIILINDHPLGSALDLKEQISAPYYREKHPQK